MKRLCTICARGGSRGVPGKNLRELGGRPLIAWSIEQALASRLFDRIAVDSDSEPILDAARAAGADLLIARPPELAADDAPKLPVIRHAVAEAERRAGERWDTVVDLDATSPLRLPDDVRAAVALLEGDAGIDNVITGSPARRSPYFNLVEADPADLADGGRSARRVRLSKPPPEAIGRRQDAPPCFDMNASIYVWRRDLLLAGGALFRPGTALLVMPEERSLDIDSELDFAIVEFLMRRRLAATAEEEER